MANTNAEMKRHPLAIAWDEWLTSPEGKGCTHFSNLTGAAYLENRLQSAFMAGASTAESNLAREVLAAVGQLNAPPHDHNMVAIRLRDLFTRLNVKIES